MNRSLAAEFLGSSFLAITVVGSGIMAQNLAGGNIALALLCNALVTGAMLYVLITLFAPLSGAHFNPVMSLLEFFSGKMRFLDVVIYILMQIIGGIIGVYAAHLMFGLPVLQVSLTMREGFSLYFAEFIATFGLVLTIQLGSKQTEQTVPLLVALYITGAYFFTASTSFANPALTIARSLTNTFAGIAPATVIYFIIAQILGGFAGYFCVRGLFLNEK